MARQLNTREYVLVAVLVAATGIAWYTMSGTDGSRRASDEAGGGASVGQAPVVEIARLAGGSEDYDQNGRNLFKYYTPPPPPRPKVERKVVTPPPKPKREAPRVVKSPTPARAATPQPPRIPFQYIGFMGPKNGKIAVFSEGEEILVAQAGDLVREQFRVVEFKYEAVVMGYVDERFKDKTTELKQQRR